MDPDPKTTPQANPTTKTVKFAMAAPRMAARQPAPTRRMLHPLRPGERPTQMPGPPQQPAFYQEPQWRPRSSEAICSARVGLNSTPDSFDFLRLPTPLILQTWRRPCPARRPVPPSAARSPPPPPPVPAID